MWVIGRTITINNEAYMSHIFGNRLYTEKDKAIEKLDEIKTTSNNYKLFKVSLMEVK